MAFRWPALAPLVFVGLVPLLAAARRGWGVAALAGAACGVAGYAAVFGWVPLWLARFQGLAPRLAWGLFALALAYHALQLVGFALGAALIARRARRAGAGSAWGGALAVAALWGVLDWAFPKLVPWSFAGALAAAPWLRQAADLGGPAGLSFAIVLVNALLLAALWPAPGERGPAAAPGRASRRLALVGAAGVLAALAGYGAWRAGMEDAATAPRVAGVLVQGGVAADAPQDELRGVQSLLRYEELTRAAALGDGDYGLVLWPETTLPVSPRTHTWYGERLARLASQTGQPLVVGAVDDAPDGGLFNSAFAFGAAGAPPGQPAVYHKAYLVPWAEYVPGRAWLPAGFTWRTTGAYRHGGPPQPFVLPARRAGLPPLRAAPSICFEAMQAGAFNAQVRAGAGVLVNLTDDGWLAGTAAPALHLQAMRLRAVETRRWLLRASNSGISAVIDPRGELVATLPFGAVGALSAGAAARHDQTLYVRAGEWVVALSALALLALALRKRRVMSDEESER